MGYKRAMRSLIAASNRADRESRAYQRQLEKQQVLYEKMVEMEQNEHTVECFNNYIDRIQSLHKECQLPYDWEKVKNSEHPVEPVNLQTNEKRALEKLNTYKPTFIDKIFNKVDKKLNQLKEDVEAAKTKDNLEYEKLLNAYNEAVEDHQEAVTLATAVINQDVKAYRTALETLTPLEELSELKLFVQYPKITASKVTISICNDNEDIVPKQQHSLLKSGKLSTKDIPTSRRNEIFQDFVCSAALRSARELFALLPINEVVVNIRNSILDTATGNTEEQTILSVKFERASINTINFDLIDPSDCMQNFSYNMNYKKTHGMLPVEEIE